LRNAYHTIIVGAGPAGLATACSLMSLGSNDFLLIERGKSLAKRTRTQTQDIPSGVGGAGLFSDGKFSFFPSATWLWKNIASDNVSMAYRWLKVILQNYNVNPPDLPTEGPIDVISNQVFKAYPSFYIDFNKRYRMIDQWSQQFRSNILTDRTVINIAKDKNVYCITTHAGVFFAENIVIATGRMGPLQLSTFTLPITKAFQRIEIGVRIKGSYVHPFFSELQQHGHFLDPKFIFTHKDHPQISWRTFCFCKRGEIMHSGSDGYVTLSGRADCPPSEESNIGFNTRIKLPSASHLLLPKLQNSFLLNLGDVYLNPSILSQYFEPAIVDFVFLGLMELKNYFSSLADASALEIAGPTIEGVGDYPMVNNQLETAQQGIYVAGDSLGLFRGLTAALLSGHTIGQQILSYSKAHSSIKSIVNL
jgi:uncharacterized FAD-dependent dehydrogenase